MAAVNGVVRRFWLPLVLVASYSLEADAEERAVATRPAWTTSRIAGTPEPPAPYRVELAFPNLRFQKPSSIEVLPGSKRLLVTEMGGKIFSFPPNASVDQADLVVDLRQLVPPELADARLALFDAEPHPQFRENRFLFVCYVHPGEGGHTRVSRLTLSSDPAPRMITGSEQVVITWPTGGHNAGCLEFAPDGTLLIATGDGSGPNPPDGLTTGQDVSDLLGAMLRIDVDRPNGDIPYTIPADNPFRQLNGARAEIWAYGLRNPWKFGVDRQTGDVYAADNGWESWEMVHRIVPGGNCGWPVMEGRVVLRSEVKPGPTPILPPVKDHPHTEANSVIGGPVYRGNKLTGLTGAFVYGDYIMGTIWAIHPDLAGGFASTTLVDTDLRVISFTEGSEGQLYVLDYDLTGQVYELLPNNEPDRSAEFPRRLSETGLFASVADLKPAPGVIPYSVVVERWMDGAETQRWVAIPGTGRIELSTTEGIRTTYPDGTVLVKNVTLPGGPGGAPIRLETQLLHHEKGVWHPYSYLWDDDGRDARLIPSRGADRPVLRTAPAPGDDSLERTWHVNASNECRACHEGAAGVVLGFVPNQLLRPRPNASEPGPVNQVEFLAQIGVVNHPVTLRDDDPRRLVDPRDGTQPLDDRARSYLHANCSMCHHPQGNAIVSFYLRRDLPFEALNTNKGTGIGTFGMREAKIVVPGDPYRSVLFYRMSKLGYARMPYIGSQIVDSAGVALIEEWIRSLPNKAESDAVRSTPAVPGSAEYQTLRALVDKSSPQPDARNEAIRQLVDSTETSLALIGLLHRAAVSAEDRRLAVTAGSRVTNNDIRGLFETFLPESQRRKTLGANIDPQNILALSGNRDRGQLIFYSDGARCRACHAIDDKNQSVGPTLKEINKKYPRPAELLQHVLQPSLKIEDPFAAFAVSSSNGRTVTGLLVEQTDREVVIKTAEKQIVRVPRGEIEELRRSPVSLMPERILSDLTAQEAADLFEYLRSLGGG